MNAKRVLRTVTVVGLAVGLLVAGRLAPPAAADVTAVTGSAFGAMVNVGLFGGPPNRVGPAPLVQLPAAGGQDAKQLPELIAQYGPATIFGGKWVEPGRNPSGPLRVTTQGTTGAGGSVTSAASITNIGPGPLIADAMASTCRATEQGLFAGVTITNGIAETKYNVATQEPIEALNVRIPTNPPPNMSVEGTLDHVGDRYRIVLNEQIVEPGKITVRAAHMYLIGPIAVGDMFVGESVCGVSSTQPVPTGPVSTIPPESPPTTATPPPAPTTIAPPVTIASPIKAGSEVPVGLAVVAVAAVILAGGLLLMIRASRAKRAKAPPPAPAS